METYRTEQRPASNIEVLHIGNFDVAVNRGTDHPELVEKALGLIRQSQDTEIEKAPWEESGMYLKRKQYLSSRLLARKNGIVPRAKRVLYALDNLLNEIKNSREIKAVIQSPEAQAIAKNYGLTGINFVEPILGIIDRKGRRDKNKYIIYLLTEGETPDESTMESDQLLALANMTREIGVLLRSNGIFSSDLNIGQFIVSRIGGSRIINLIDTEGYIEIKHENPKF